MAYIYVKKFIFFFSKLIINSYHHTSMMTNKQHLTQNVINTVKENLSTETLDALNFKKRLVDIINDGTLSFIPAHSKDCYNVTEQCGVDIYEPSYGCTDGLDFDNPDVIAINDKAIIDLFDILSYSHALPTVLEILEDGDLMQDLLRNPVQKYNSSQIDTFAEDWYGETPADYTPIKDIAEIFHEINDTLLWAWGKVHKLEQDCQNPETKKKKAKKASPYKGGALSAEDRVDVIRQACGQEYHKRYKNLSSDLFYFLKNRFATQRSKPNRAWQSTEIDKKHKIRAAAQLAMKYVLLPDFKKPENINTIIFRAFNLIIGNDKEPVSFVPDYAFDNWADTPETTGYLNRRLDYDEAMDLRNSLAAEFEDTLSEHYDYQCPEIALKANRVVNELLPKFWDAVHTVSINRIGKLLYPRELIVSDDVIADFGKTRTKKAITNKEQLLVKIDNDGLPEALSEHNGSKLDKITSNYYLIANKLFKLHNIYFLQFGNKVEYSEDLR